MGGTQFKNLSRLAKGIWKWCIEHTIFIFASYIKSKDNSIADAESRQLEPGTEYSLSRTAFKKLCASFGYPEIDLFAT